MNRRTFLTRGALALGIAATSGCTERVLEEAESKPPLFDDVYHEEEVDLPVAQKFDAAEEATLRADGESFDDLEQLRTYLDEQELDVETLYEAAEDGETLVELEYADEQFSDRGSVYGLGIVCGGYAALIDSGYAADTLEATILDSEGRTFGGFEIATALTSDYLAERETAATYAGTVADTLGSQR